MAKKATAEKPKPSQNATLEERVARIEKILERAFPGCLK